MGDSLGDSALRRLAEILAFEGRVKVSDIGSNPVEGDPPYKCLIDANLCEVTGFEPQSETMAPLVGEEWLTILPWALGDGGEIEFKICAHSGWSSALEPSHATVSVFSQYERNATVVDRVTLTTRRLDDVAEINEIDLLKIDVQGSELPVLANARNKLGRAVFVHTEVSFFPLYENQPTLGDVDGELRKQGFLPHTFVDLKKAIIPPMNFNGDPWISLQQLLDGDMVYVRDFRRLDAMADRQLKVMALIGHGCYKSWDLAYRNVLELERRGAIHAGGANAYIDVVNSILQER
jgi:FkbM family methyltransferase